MMNKRSENRVQPKEELMPAEDKHKLGFLDKIAITLAVWRTILPWGLLMGGLVFLLLFALDRLL